MPGVVSTSGCSTPQQVTKFIKNLLIGASVRGGLVVPDKCGQHLWAKGLGICQSRVQAIRSPLLPPSVPTEKGLNARDGNDPPKSLLVPEP